MGLSTIRSGRCGHLHSRESRHSHHCALHHPLQGAYPNLSSQILPSLPMERTPPPAPHRHSCHERRDFLLSFTSGHHLLHQQNQQRGFSSPHLLCQHDYVHLPLLHQHHSRRRHPRRASRRSNPSQGCLHLGQLLFPPLHVRHPLRLSRARAAGSPHSGDAHRQSCHHRNRLLGARGRLVS